MKKQKEITEQQYRDAVKTVLTYRAQVTEHSKKINAEVTELNPNAKRIWGKQIDFSHCTKNTPLMHSRMSRRLFNILTQNRAMNHLNFTPETPLEELSKLSVNMMGMQRNFGVKCMNELNEICRVINIKMQP